MELDGKPVGSRHVCVADIERMLVMRGREGGHARARANDGRGSNRGFVFMRHCGVVRKIADARSLHSNDSMTRRVNAAWLVKFFLYSCYVCAVC